MNQDANQGGQSKLIIEGGATAPTASAPQGPLIIQSDENNFVRDVIEASNNVPVIVDFWAPEAASSEALGAALEKIVTRAGGLLRLVKINANENRGLAQQLRIQSIPTVYAFKDGKPVDAFQGALPESQLQAFIDKLIGDAKSPIDAAMDAGNQALAAGDGGAAEDIFMQILSHDETVIAALGGLVRAQVLSGNLEGARETVSALDDKTKLNTDVAGAIAVLELAEESSAAAVGNDEMNTLVAKVQSNPKDMDTGLELALAYYANNNTEAAINQLLEMISKDKKWNEAAARKQLIKIFDALGGTNPLTIEGRQKLSIILFS
ncbi:MAG: tetratricopeptide repeat protein [Rhodospirillaceae bacterium]|nr:tetratricopeptide repeat protein [Rhodospirillaceae bacterium]